MTPLPVPRAELGATRYLTRLGSECEVVFRTYVVSRLFYEADRGPRLAALPENRPRRNRIAPVCCLHCAGVLCAGIQGHVWKEIAAPAAMGQGKTKRAPTSLHSTSCAWARAPQSRLDDFRARGGILL